MSNQQWNSEQGSPEWGAQPQPSAPEWQQAAPQQDWSQAQPQVSAQEWQQPANEWAQPQTAAADWQQAQPQPSAADWQQTAPQQDWTQAQPQPSAADWQQTAPQQDWTQAQPQPSATDWQQTAVQQPAVAQPWQQAPVAAAKPNPFDFSFKTLALPSAASLIFIIGVAALSVEWLFSFIAVLAGRTEYYSPSAVTIIHSLIGGLADVLFKVIFLRIILEIGVAVTRLLEKNDTSL